MSARAARVLFWLYALLAAPTALLACAVILIIAGGHRFSGPAPDWPALLAAATVLGMLGLGYRLATGNHPLRASLLVVASWVVFASIMLINGLMHQTLWN